MWDLNKRDDLLIERRKGVARGDNNLAVENYFTHSFNMGCGDRSYMNCIWQVVALTAQQVYAKCVINAEKIEDINDKWAMVGRSNLFDRGEYQFYDASELYTTIIEERKQAIESAQNDNEGIPQ